MRTTEIVVRLDDSLLERLDRLVNERQYPSRDWVIEQAIRQKVNSADPSRLARESRKLDPFLEQAMAEEGLAGDLEAWPEY